MFSTLFNVAQEEQELPVCMHPSASSISLRYRLAGSDTDTVAAAAVATVQCIRMGNHVLAAGRAAHADGAAAGTAHHTSVSWQPVDQSSGSAAQTPATAAAAASRDSDLQQRAPLDVLLHVSWHCSNAGIMIVVSDSEFIFQLSS